MSDCDCFKPGFSCRAYNDRHPSTPISLCAKCKARAAAEAKPVGTIAAVGADDVVAINVDGVTASKILSEMRESALPPHFTEYAYTPPTSEPKKPSTRELIERECDALKQLLLAKNAAYGDSATNPVRVFSRVDAAEAIKIRCDDKLSRISRGHAMPDETMRDTIRDLAGYLILLLALTQEDDVKR